MTRVREVCDSAAGTLRTISAGRFTADYHDGLSDEEKAKRVTTNPRFDVRATGLERNPSSPPTLHSLSFYDIEIAIEVSRPLSFSEATSDALRDDVLALAMQDGDVLAQALGYPGNLTTTSGGTATNLISGLLTHLGSEAGRTQTPTGDRPGLATTIHRFRGTAHVTQATS